jgi:deoxyribonuclease-1
VSDVRLVALGFALLASCAVPPASDDEPFVPPGKGDIVGNLREQLHRYVTDKSVALSYYDARQAMFGVTASFDIHDGTVECIYTGKHAQPDGTNTPGGFNTEHSWPQSMGAEMEPPRSDLHHIFAVDEEANSARASFPFGTAACAAKDPATCAWHGGGSALDQSSPTTAVFEVRPERRGDIARAHFYFAVRYDLPIPDDEEAVLRAWHEADPPDAVEAARDEGIFAIQHNHNPFVQWPELVGELNDF